MKNDPVATVMIDLPDELILLLLEKLNGNSLLRCRKACRLLYRISLDRILLSSNFNTISNDGILLLVEEIINNREMFMDVIEDGRWGRMIDNLIRRQFRLFEKLMPDNSYQSFLTISFIDHTAWHEAQYAAMFVVFYDDRSITPYVALAESRNTILILDRSQHVAQNAIWDVSLKIAPCRYTVSGLITRGVKSTIDDIIIKDTDLEIRRHKAWHLATYIFLNMLLEYNIDSWNTVHHYFDGLTLPEMIPPFWDDPSLQNNARVMEYKRLFSPGEK